MELLEKYTELEKEEMALVLKKDEILKSNELIFKAITEIDSKANELANKKAEMREQLLIAMEENNVKKFENDLLMITYVAPTTRIGIDNDKLKNEFEDVYLQCLKETPVKSSVRIKIKND